MTSPASALTWEIWRRHRARLSVMGILLCAFALLYPRLCALIGLDLNSPDALDSIATAFAGRLKDVSPLSAVFRVLSLLFFLLGPLACMVVSLLYVVWIFTFAQLDAKKGFAFPARLFTLPVSTKFLASWLLGVGLAALVLVYLGWTSLVRLPKIEVFAGYSNCLAWITLLVVAQAIIWALDAFPVARVLSLCAALAGFCFLTGPALRDHPLLARNQIMILLSFLTSGTIVAFAGLSKIRHGAWQRWTWGRRFRPLTSPARTERAEVTRSGAGLRFSSPNRAQFWFEWRSHAGKLFFYVCGLSGAGLLVMTVVALGNGSLSEGDLHGLSLFLLAVPLFIHFAHGVAPERNLPPFLATRPLASGDIVMAKLAAAALGAVLSWAVTLAMFCVVPLLGDVPAMLAHLPLIASYPVRLRPLLPVILLGLMLLTWRFVAADLCFSWTGRAWAARLAVAKTYGILGAAGLVALLGRDPRFADRSLQVLPYLLACLVLLKLFFAQWAFRTALDRELLARSSVLQYLAAWLILATVLLVPTLVLLHAEAWAPSLALGIILLLPLARIGFACLALSHGRHR